ncbi:MAG TPA: DJ-1/PfpI family protein [Puia sp.]
MRKIILMFALLLPYLTAVLGQSPEQKDKVIYVCPPCGADCDKLEFDQPGTCPKCGMLLVKKSITEFRKEQNFKPISVCFYIQDGIDLLDFAGPMEVFSTAGFKVFTVSKTKNIIHTHNSLSVTPEYSLQDAPAADVLVISGGNISPTMNDPEVIKWIQTRQKTSQYTLSVCTGAFILGKANILDGLSATTWYQEINNLAKANPKTKVVDNTRYVDNGNVITTAGVAAGLDGALHLVEKLRDRNYAKETSQAIEYDKWDPGQGLITTKDQ